MSGDSEEIKNKIEVLRKELNSSGNVRGLQDKNVYLKSRALDKLIADYYKKKQKGSNKKQ